MEPNRQLWLQYDGRGYAELAVIGAIRRGIVAPSEVAPEVLELLRPRLEQD